MSLFITVGVERPGMRVFAQSVISLRMWYLACTMLVRSSCCGCVASGCLSASAGTKVAACCSAAASGLKHCC